MDSRNTITVTEDLSADLDYPNSIDLIVEDKCHDLCRTCEIVDAPSLASRFINPALALSTLRMKASESRNRAIV